MLISVQFLAQLGYCPQNDAINPLLSAREMLYMYALLRGISSSRCSEEVSRWLRIIGKVFILLKDLNVTQLLQLVIMTEVGQLK